MDDTQQEKIKEKSLSSTSSSFYTKQDLYIVLLRFQDAEALLSDWKKSHFENDLTRHKLHKTFTELYFLGYFLSCEPIAEAAFLGYSTASYVDGNPVNRAGIHSAFNAFLKEISENLKEVIKSSSITENDEYLRIAPKRITDVLAASPILYHAIPKIPHSVLSLYYNHSFNPIEISISAEGIPYCSLPVNFMKSQPYWRNLTLTCLDISLYTTKEILELLDYLTEEGTLISLGRVLSSGPLSTLGRRPLYFLLATEQPIGRVLATLHYDIKILKKMFQEEAISGDPLFSNIWPSKKPTRRGQSSAGAPELSHTDAEASLNVQIAKGWFSAGYTALSLFSVLFGLLVWRSLASLPELPIPRDFDLSSLITFMAKDAGVDIGLLLVTLGAFIAVAWPLLIRAHITQLKLSRSYRWATKELLAGNDAVAFSGPSLSPFQTFFNTLAARLGEKQKYFQLLSIMTQSDLWGMMLTTDIEELKMGREIFVTILYTDIRNFTRSTEESGDSSFTSKILNEHLSAMALSVQKFGGVVDKYIGDSIMGTWGIVKPQGIEKDAENCIHAALEMRQNLILHNQSLEKRGIPPLAVGCGINSGMAHVGLIGEEKVKMDYTVIGDSVNTASRVESVVKIINIQRDTNGYVDVLINDQTYALVKDKFDTVPLPPIPVKGKKVPLRTYAILGELQKDEI